MKLTALKSAAFLLLAIGVQKQVAAQDRNPLNVVTTAVPFLRISPDARAGGMGDVGIATPPDANSTFWNLAKTPFAKENSGIGVTYTPWLGDITKDVFLATLAGYYKLDEEQALSASLRYFNLGHIDFTDQNGNPLGGQNPREFSFDIGYSRKLSEKLGVGATFRYINSKLASGSYNGNTYKAGSAFATDLSLYHHGINEEGSGFNWGIVLSNLGSKISYTNNATTKDFIPANLGIGGAYTSTFDETSRITFGLDLNKLLVPVAPVDSAGLAEYHSYGVFESWFKSFNGDNGGLKSIQASLGAEYAYNEQFFARAGYFYESQQAGDRKYFTLGVGLQYSMINLNFSYLIPSGNGVTRNPLSNTLRFGVIFNLGQSADQNNAGN
ncbi:type IX secretion system outer membrane channel protein PorV [Deminuibacter soli]|uniref:Type IX secretion system protein PorV domain-containing protein n=1 Tax=Deminuibacter soli TaxID=2291815 RepID=A0A3E1NPE6_9BACT|nr:type IX secretion system outer membrane channel protein PorV [Deminuibacter soli]RFM29658.1 hypothetical protein DXN05_01360 [Deminuibacter soli]